ncbi:hypothetical protein GCM10023351_20420 [Microbacterium gilvum]|uniref:DNA methylase N-4/N-6 domain-containing protein n=1 Tax=Microbacterium gilvum TaxID=1336204 RepID=A0ABP9A9G4_9MICO
MPRLAALIAHLRETRPELAEAVAREVAALPTRQLGVPVVSERLAAPGLRAAPGDIVRLLPPRGIAVPEDSWRVLSVEIDRACVVPCSDGRGTAIRTVGVDDLVVLIGDDDPRRAGLVQTGRVARGGDRPWHVVIESENVHALRVLHDAHAGAVDAIYIDPPYNTGARDWMYDNDFAQGGDRHSAWLAFMERRLVLARGLLDPRDSVLIVTIDEKEYLRLGLLLEQVFPDARIQMVSTVIKPGGVARGGAFARSDEFVFFVMLGSAAPRPQELGREWGGTAGRSTRGRVHWNQLHRRGADGVRTRSPGCFYPVLVEQTATGARIVGVGEALAEAAERPRAPVGVVAVWPPARPDGADGRWSTTPEHLRELMADGFVRTGRYAGAATPLYYLSQGERDKVQAGEYVLRGRDENGVAVIDDAGATTRFLPTTQWNISRHDASRHGSNLLARLLGDRHFPYPKSLHAVEDALRFFLADKPEATVLDFFAGSGTTAHAVMRLNRHDGGRRRSISVTNNDVGAADAARMRTAGLRPGDAQWEAQGVFRRITRPRIEAAVTGRRPDGAAVAGAYADGMRMSEGFAENVAFFSLVFGEGMAGAAGSGEGAGAERDGEPARQEADDGRGGRVDPSRDDGRRARGGVEGAECAVDDLRRALGAGCGEEGAADDVEELGRGRAG